MTRLEINDWKTQNDEHLLVVETRVLDCLSRHEQRLQNGMLKVLKQLKELQEEPASNINLASFQIRG